MASLFDWRILFVGVSTLVAAAFVLFATRQGLDIAILGFTLAGAWLFGKLVVWGVSTSKTLPVRACVMALVLGAFGVGFAEVVRLTAWREAGPTAIWTDPETKLMWANRDNGRAVTWYDAEKFCKTLTLSGYAGWRLPEISELQGIFEGRGLSDESLRHKYQYRGEPYPSGGVTDCQKQETLLRGGIELNACCAWSATPKGTEALYYRFQPNRASYDRESSNPLGSVALMRALCVRSP
jgi:hypothetical protein